jgi:hypothetical protein
LLAEEQTAEFGSNRNVSRKYLKSGVIFPRLDAHLGAIQSRE